MSSKKMRTSRRVSSKTKQKYKNISSQGKRKPGEKPKDFKGTALRLLSFTKPHIAMLILVLVAGTVSTILNISGPLLLGNIVDLIETQVSSKLSGGTIDLSEIGLWLLIILAIYVLSSLASYVQSYTMAGITQSIVRTLRERVNGKLSKLPLKYFDKNSKGDILSKIMNDIDNISNTFQHNFVQMLTSGVSFIGMLAMMFYTNVRLTLITLALLPLSMIVVFLISKRSKRYFRQQWDRMGELNGHIEEMYSGHKLVKIFDREEASIEEFDDINSELTLVSHKAQFISGLISPILNFVNNISYVIICVIGGLNVVSGAMSIGGIVAFFTYSKLFMQPLVDLGNIASRLQSSLASAERVFSLLDEEEEIPDNPLHKLEKCTGRVQFENVSFRYSEDKPLIEGLNLNAEPGSLIAIVGPTGAGKTTIVNLLMRFYDVCDGKILVDGIDIRDLSRGNLRNIFGMVLQDTWLFKGTIKENIAYGRKDATDEEIYEAAAAARVTHFVSTISEGYDTLLEEDGANVSQGQRQLLTIARAILANPSILILDEATSSVDTRTEIQIQKAMKTLMSNRTSFVIAHRLSTIREADTILVMNHGQIVEQGKHEELLAANGFYTSLYNSQFGAAAEAESTAE